MVVPRVAEMTAVVLVTAAVVIVKVALELPAGMETDAGTDAAVLFDDSEIVRFVAAGPVTVTVPVAGLPPTIVDGEIVKDARSAGTTTIEAAAEYWFSVAVTVAPVGLVTGEVVTAKGAVVAPALTMAVPGTPAAAELLDVRTMVVSTAAGVLSVTVPLATFPPARLAGATFSESIEIVAMVSTPRPSYT